MPTQTDHAATIEQIKSNPRQHHPRMVQSKDVHAEVHGSGPMGRFNNALAVGITKSVGTMWCAYVFTLIAIAGGVAVVTNNTFATLLITLISQTFLQLVLLPVIIVGQNVISTAQDVRAEADHETLIALHTMNVQQLQILEQQQKILDILQHK